ncbi:unnamed protein product [Tilletia caries]|uniref:Uncharacterized protein n=1 Tax=Tilletia caries TaxID=13290 RepID=A0ABN7IZ98_9BASI|nr:unnamed protein product [Tilletia caries]CAD7068565.1 unnamed protein product [Tilletia caries]
MFASAPTVLFRPARRDSLYPFSPLARHGTSNNPFTVLDSDDEAGNDLKSGFNVDHGAYVNHDHVYPAAVSSAGATVDDEDYDDPYNDVDEDIQVDTVVADLSANAVVDMIKQVIENGSNGHPSDYTEPSYREHLDNCLGAYSKSSSERATTARNATLASNTVSLRRLLSKTGNGTNRFPMDPRSLWNKSKPQAPEERIPPHAGPSSSSAPKS